MKKALIAIDYVNEWTDKNSDYYVGNISDKIEKLNKLIEFCRQREVPIIFTRHIEPESKTAFVKGTDNVKIIKGINYQKDKDTLITKNKISPFYNTELGTKLKELKSNELIITGILTNLCVRSCISDAYDRDYKITVISDTCVAFTKEAHEYTFKDLKDTRPEIEFLTVDEFIKKNSY